jgi:hypothetical protein
MGDSIVDGLAKEGIRTEHVCHGEGPSPFTYIIVDRTGGTCLQRVMNGSTH